MAHSFVEFQNKQFMLNDIDLIIFTKIFTGVALDRASISNNIQKMLNSWERTVSVSGPGAIDLELDEYIVDEETKNFFCANLEYMLQKFVSIGEILSAQELNTILNQEIKFNRDRKTVEFKEIVRQFQNILQC